MPTRSSSKSAPPPLPTHADPAESEPRPRRAWLTNGCIRTTVTLVIFAAYFAWTWPWYFHHDAPAAPELPEADGEATHVGAEGVLRAPPLPGVPKGLQTKWAQYSPWHPVDEYRAPPAGCNITQVNILQRHGARFPNAEDGENYAQAVEHLAAADKFRDKRLKFLEKYEYELGADDLVPFGAAQTFEAGQVAFKRYAHLVNSTQIPYVRAAGAPRVISTATNWTVGFAAASHQRYQPYLNQIISEEYNNTLNNDCPNANNGSHEMGIWMSHFAPPITKRLLKGAPGVNLTNVDVFNLLAMCPFESVAKEALSPFCSMFTEDDFRAFEYTGDLEKYYRTGYGEPLGPIQGVGYVNELLARLTGTPVKDRTTHNASLEFPLDRVLYADFTHENLMVAVYAAMGLFNISRPLDPRHLPAPDHPAGQKWVASRMVPFSARMVVERLACVDAEHGRVGEGAYVRVLVNDQEQPLEFCGGKGGLCALEKFVESQGYARRSGGGDFDKCY
ncbi:acid phosphatase [Trametes versicolor FP-101664 SS1]|uniref:acid phosphatase n=1 Tax=Trametes versicolor (strain FP-101664) TaxID=717944 RepID=UPI0004623DDF|nr:acid phosphatase [Trametes versicolor FP-101664 SS1]EIW52336.1 acid phosphatase [Trametes versicolor FP-101664 SS1]